MDHVSTEWRKSTYSGGNGGECVEVARSPPGPLPSATAKTLTDPSSSFRLLRGSTSPPVFTLLDDIACA